MKLSRIKLAMGTVLACLFVAASLALAQQPRTQRPQADIKITYKVTMQGGMQTESTTMIKGVRERSETNMGFGGMSMSQVNITQCDLRQTIQLSDKTKKYIITPMESDSTETAPAPTAEGRSGPSRRGGTVTYDISAIDTGERKEMFGFSARHVKTSIRVESSPDACNPQKQHIEQDGWYIDLNFGLNCEVGRPQMAGRPSPTGCQDRMRYRHEGSGRAGYPLIETMTVYDQNDRPQFSTTKEVVELSRQPLDAALFDVPAGYTKANSTQELYAFNPSDMMQEMMKGRQPTAGNENLEMPGTTPAESKQPGTIRVGVIQINNKTDRSVSTDSLRERLIGGIQGSNIEAVPLNAISASEADVEAKAKQCDYILYTDISALKVSAAKKLGGVFGRATGVGSGGIDKTESKVDFKLFPVGDSSPRLQSSASGKEEGDDASAGAAVDTEARMVSAAVRKRG